MNIAIEARALLTTSGGIRSYVQNLTDRLRTRSDVSLDIIDGSATSATPLRNELVVPYWLNSRVSTYLQKTKPDVVHFTKAAVPAHLLIPSVVTIYDIIPVLLPETQSILRRLYWPKALRNAATHATHVITISERSKQDIIHQFGVAEEKITAIPLAIDTNHFKPQEVPKESIILFVGTWDARKNISTLIHAFNTIADSIPHTLIIAGKPAHKDDGSRNIAAQSPYADRIQFKENVPYDELPSLYAKADLFVFPSAYEGWGFPPQEAMACGTPVIVSDGGSLPEVVGASGIVVPFSQQDIHARMHDEDFTQRLAQEMLSVITNPQRKEEMIQKGIRQATSQTWEHVTDATIDVYKKII